MKELWALSATILILVAYVPYIQDIRKKKTVPHIYSWLVSGLITFIAFGLQLSKGAGWGVVPTFFAALAGLIIFILSLGHARANITKLDTFFFIMALIAIILWLIVDQAVLSIIIISLIDVLAFIPTIRKSWERPDQETVSAYFVNTLRFTASTIAVQKYSVVTVLYPASAAAADGSIALYLMLRRHILKHK